MNLRPYKFIVQAVVQQVEGDDVVGESAAEPVTLFGAQAVVEWAEGFADQLATLEE